MTPNDFKIMHVNLALEFRKIHPEYELDRCRLYALALLNACGVVADEPEPCEYTSNQVIDALAEALQGMLGCDWFLCPTAHKLAWKKRAVDALKLAKKRS